MDWKSIGQSIAKEAPLLGTLLGGPGGAALGAIVASALGTAAAPEDVVKELQGNPDAIVKVKAIEAEHVEKMQQLAVDQAGLDLQAVQAEGKSDHWPTYSWRPFIGASFGLYINSLWLLPLFHVQPVTLSPDTVMAIGAILGIASWFRGKMQADPAVASDPRG